MSRLQNTQYILDGLPELMKLDTGLRKSQIKVLNAFLEADIATKQIGIFNLATGFGKTRMMSILALAYKRANPKGRVLIVVPSTSLIKDENGDGVVKKFHVYNREDLKSDDELDFGTYYGKGLKSTETEFTVTTYSSLAKYAKKINPKDIGLLLLDEAHHALSETRSETIRQFSNAAQYGMTATPGYDPEKDLENLLENYIASVTIEEAIKEGDLADTKNVILVSGTPVDLTKVPKAPGSTEYSQKEYMKAIARAMNANSVTSGNEDNWKDVHCRIAEQIAEFYRDYEDDEAGKIFGKKCMINCRSQEEARITALTINRIFGKMMAATYLSGNSGTENEDVLKNFVDGKLPILCQVGKLSEGFDFSDLDIVINFPTCSRVREGQLGGRAIRKHKNRKKTALVVDIAFAHPDGKNVIDSIHKNGQVLFQDIVGTPIVQKDEEKKVGIGPRTGKPTIRLKYFNIISDKRTLLYLSNETKKLEEERAREEIELRRGYTSYDLAKVIDVHVMTARNLIRRYKNKTFLNPETGKEEAYTKMLSPLRGGEQVLGLTILGFKKIVKDWQKAKQGYTLNDLSKAIHISSCGARKLIKLYQDKTVLNPETGEEEPCTKIVKGDDNQDSLGLTELGFEKVVDDWEKSHQGYTSSDLAEAIISQGGTISQSGACRLLKRYKDKKVLNSETGEEESCTKMVFPATSGAVLGLTKLGFEKAIKDWWEEHEGVTSSEVAQKLHMKGITARIFIKSYEGKTVLNPETGEEEPCTKMVTPKKGPTVLGFTKLGFEKAIKDWQEEHEGFSCNEVSKRLGIPRTTTKRLIKHFKDRKVVNPETGVEEPCTKRMRDAKGQDCIGLTKLGLELAFKECKEKRATLRPKLVVSARGKFMASPARKKNTPEI